MLSISIQNIDCSFYGKKSNFHEFNYIHNCMSFKNLIISPIKKKKKSYYIKLVNNLYNA